MPSRKWTNEEIKIILKYLQEFSAKEAPTKQIFCKNPVGRSDISAKWNLIKLKVKSFSSTFKKPTECQTGPRNYDTRRSEVMEMSPQRQQLNEFCDEKTQSWIGYNLRDTGDSIILDKSKGMHTVLSDSVAEKVLTWKRTAVDINYSARVKVLDIEGNVINQTPSTSLHSNPGKSIDIPKKAKEFVKKLKKFKQSSAGCLASLQAKRTEKSRRKFEWEGKKHEKEMEWRDKKMELEEEWTKAEIDRKRKELELRKKEIEKEEKLKILDMEKEERLRKYELELKYKSEC